LQEVIDIQAKRYSKPVGNKAVQEVIAAKAYYRCDEALVISNNSYTKSAKDLAQKVGVSLWSKKELMKMISN
jgi:restriction system protein